MTEHDIDRSVADADPSEGDLDSGFQGADATDPTDTEALRQELEQVRAQYQRAVADYQNLERRSREERAEASRLALSGVIVGFLPVLDDLERAIEAGEQAAGDAGEQVWLEGVRLVVQKFNQTLAANGVQEIHALNQPFDPTRHEAVGSAPGPEGVVVHLLRRGYVLRDHVVRPAMVMVGSGEGAAPAAPEATAED